MSNIKKISLTIEEAANDRRTGGRTYNRVFKNKPTKYKGVVFYKDRKPAWAMRVYYEGKTITLNGFESDSEAALAYDYATAYLFKREPSNALGGDFREHRLYPALISKLKKLKPGVKP